MCSVPNCCRKASVNLRCYSEAIIYTNIVGDMGESNDCINSILLKKNIYKEIPINFFLLTTPVKDTPLIKHLPSLNMKVTSKLENYCFLMRQKKKDTLINVFAVFTIKFLHLKLKLNF